MQFDLHLEFFDTIQIFSDTIQSSSDKIQILSDTIQSSWQPRFYILHNWIKVEFNMGKFFWPLD